MSLKYAIKWINIRKFLEQYLVPFFIIVISLPANNSRWGKNPWGWAQGLDPSYESSQPMNSTAFEIPIQLLLAFFFCTPAPSQNLGEETQRSRAKGSAPCTCRFTSTYTGTLWGLGTTVIPFFTEEQAKIQRHKVTFPERHSLYLITPRSKSILAELLLPKALPFWGTGFILQMRML